MEAATGGRGGAGREGTEVTNNNEQISIHVKGKEELMRWGQIKDRQFENANRLSNEKQEVQEEVQKNKTYLFEDHQRQVTDFQIFLVRKQAIIGQSIQDKSSQAVN